MTKTAKSPPPSVEIHIEELVLHGLAPSEGDRFDHAVERELTRLLAEQGLLTAMTRDLRVAELHGHGFEVKRDTDAETAGAWVAKVIHGGLDK